jgi:hypothetical protein
MFAATRYTTKVFSRALKMRIGLQHVCPKSGDDHENAHQAEHNSPVLQNDGEVLDERDQIETFSAAHFGQTALTAPNAVPIQVRTKNGLNVRSKKRFING